MKLFDIEANGLLHMVTKVHCIVMMDTKTGRRDQFAGETLEDGVRALMEATMAGELIAGHNIIKYDIPVLKRLYDWFNVLDASLVDSLVLARVMWSDIGAQDDVLISRNTPSNTRFPKALRGRHSLQAWGWRLGNRKGDFGADDEERRWDVFVPEMLDYCTQDVDVAHTLMRFLTRQPYPRGAIALEHAVAHTCAQMERAGWPFDETTAATLTSKLVAERTAISEQLQVAFPPLTVEKAGKATIQDFNPGSRKQIADRLTAKYRWVPTEKTTKGAVKIDDDILAALHFPEAKILSRYFTVDKRLGQLAEGNQAWLKLVRDGHLHGSINTNGAVTGRCTHARPNIAQVPSSNTAYGPECRALFTVRPGFSAVGADLSGIELRCLAHYMAPWDHCKYVETILYGDVHTENQHTAGLPTRDAAKTFIYAFLYGAGDERLGQVIGADRAAGARLRQTFLSRTPALRFLKASIALEAQRGVLTGLDGRHLPVRSAHAALNTKLQSAGALISKRWLVECVLEAERRGLRHGWDGDFVLLGYIHDELQWATRTDIADDFGRMVVVCAERAGTFFLFKCPIAAEFKVGANWHDTH
ncbi:DNA polymerase [Variovorax sp. LG9.2]|uniref:DNA polymerase n=1 Tax=Variovorax sp. LG9.2 TaxID=3048626 RepID=UPI002B22D2AB|nr:DNA polymerase [Variovorax sp. LG9.2]MEB0056722.1 DNA polymerase [Variovorax sp. LG9.2]